jgi:hypothetical protein
MASATSSRQSTSFVLQYECRREYSPDVMIRDGRGVNTQRVGPEAGDFAIAVAFLDPTL